MNARVLMIGAHPDDEDTNLLTWLSRGRHIQTAYLSLTRGDGGQNIIGNELGEALGVIRTEELLAARRIDGAGQYFTRAFDFGFSKDTVDTYKFWVRDSILGDVIRVVRDFRPHVIIAVFSGTPRDGHGHHQVSGLLARAAYDLAGDTIRFPRSDYGMRWTPLKFYRAARFNAQAGTLSVDVGEYSPVIGRYLGEIAGESRSQHRSQGFGTAQRKGPMLDYVTREASRVNESSAATAEKSIFDGIDTSWARFKGAWTGRQAGIDSIPALVASVRAEYRPLTPSSAVRLLSALHSVAHSLRFDLSRCGSIPSGVPSVSEAVCGDLTSSLDQLLRRSNDALRSATGISVEIISAHDAIAAGAVERVAYAVYNPSSDTVHISFDGVWINRPPLTFPTFDVPPHGAVRDSMAVQAPFANRPMWLTQPRRGAMFAPIGAQDETRLIANPSVSPNASGRGIAQFVPASGVVTRVTIDETKGEVRRPVDGVPLLSVTMDQSTEYVNAKGPIDQTITVHVRSADDSVRTVRVTLAAPRGLVVDSATRSLVVSKASVPVQATFRVHGRLSPGEYSFDALAEYDGKTYTNGYTLIEYEHIRRQRMYRPATTKIAAVDIAVPARLKVAYVGGVGDNVAPTLSQLGVAVTQFSAADIGKADLAGFSTVVIGPRAYEAHPELLAANPKLFEFARKGGVLLVQYGQYEMLQPGAMPYPITLSRPADRVTDETANITIESPNARELSAPNKITNDDFSGWVQERSLYMPHTFDSAYRPLFSMKDPNELPNKGGVLIAPMGQGLYIYTTMSFFRQLPAGNPGAARLFLNLMSAKLAPTVTP